MNQFIKHLRSYTTKWINNNYKHKRRFGSIKSLSKMAIGNNSYGSNHPTSVLFPALGVSVGVGMIGSVLFKNHYERARDNEDEGDGITLLNWSGTHSATPDRYWTPSTSIEVENIVKHCHKNNIPVRPMGSGLSPNGVAFSNYGVIDMGLCNKVLNIDENKRQITVQAGCKIRDVLKALENYDMTLENIPSIVEQQIGGLIQTGAHGTGSRIPPCDMQIKSMKIVTPTKGLIELNQNDRLFYYARVGLGCLGIVTEVTIQCVPKGYLSEYIWVLNHEELIQHRDELVNKFKHIKFLWIPYTKKVVIIAAEPCDNDEHLKAVLNTINNDVNREVSLQQPMRELYCKLTNKNIDKFNSKYMNSSFADMRDILLGINDAKDSLNVDIVKGINNAELQYWENVSKQCGIKYDNETYMDKPLNIDLSQNVLTFDCGGQQLVYEICFNTRELQTDTYIKNDNNNIPKDIQFMLDLLDEIETNNIPAPAPLEQRYTAYSTSKLSPAYSTNNSDIFSWVGVIMYLPTQNDRIRSWISNEFESYSSVLNNLIDKYNGVSHWAKAEVKYLNNKERKSLQKRIGKRYKHLNQFLKYQTQLDPQKILMNDITKDLFDV